MQTYQQQLKQKFNEAYQQLNPQQRIAVDTIEGPVMVIAGPGTGKTQILAARIGKILLETDVLPENILCLTYTDAGAIAMRRRLQQFIGADAYKVNIYTFHAFCNDVIQDNLSLFEKTSLDAISELENIQLFKTLIDNFPKNHPLKRYRGDVYFEINNLRNLFSSMKREGWSPEYINQKIDDYLKDLPLRDEFIYKRKYRQFNAGDLKQDKIDEEKERIEKLRAAVNEFERYQQLMRQRNRYDFDDMINWVIKAFEENKNMLAAYQEKFQYILVDEFQDTSGTQNRLVQLLINYWDKPNIFVVGDDDQSIYRFQGANVENMLDFANTYSKDLTTIVLTSNYRSTQPILDISKTLINKNAERLVKQIDGLSKELLSCNNKINHLTHQPVIVEYNSVRDEMADITNKVFALLQDGVKPGRIAVIYKENKYGEELANYFRLKGIPFFSKRSINILEQPFTRKIIQLLRYLNAEHDIPYGGDEMLFEILHYDFYKIPPIEIAKLTVEVNQKKYGGESTSLRKLLSYKANTAPKNLFDTGIHQGLKNISKIIEQLIADVPNVTIQQLFDNIIRNAGILTYIMQRNDKIVLMQLLSALFDFIKEESSRSPTLNLKGLMEIIDLMEKEAITLPMIQVSGSDKGVNLLTAHGSKGLEFEYVFFVGVNASSWEKKRKPGGGYKLPDTMFSSQPKAGDDEELRRLFYVALTRAETHLYISYAKLKNDAKEMEPSMFIAEIQELHHLPIEKITLTDEEMMQFQLLHFTAQAPEIEKAEEDFIGNLLEKFSMNVTALNSYLKCPLGFYYQNLIRIPSGKNEATEFGSAVHYALEKFFRKMQDGKQEKFPPKEEMIADFNWYMYRHRENFTREAFERRMEYGDTVLGNYYDKYINSWNKVVAVERNIRGVVVNGVPLKGKLDKLEFTGKEINVVDYKSGDIDKAIPKMKGPGEKDPNGGDYWRQAVFYKLLIDNYEQKDWKVISTEFDFVEPDKKGVYRKEKIIITPQDTETVKRQLTEVWGKIQARDFYTGCGKEDCHWCNFVKDNQLAVALHDMDEETENE
jgi:DNA helicase-2/ATP-dependent DNA helicase PcrA